MKILYIAQIDNHSSSGVNKKINSQCKAFIELGHECYCLFLNNSHNIFKYSFLKFSDNNTIIEKSINKYPSSLFLNKIITVFMCFLGVPKDIINAINVIDFDIIYVRHLLPVSPKYISFLKNIKNKAKVFNELFTYPYIKDMFMYKGLGKYLIYMFEFRSIERLRSVVDEFVVVAEIEDIKARKRLGKYRVIPNGFEVSSVNSRIAPLLENEIHILGLANLACWHGYDRIIAGMAEYNGPYKIVFHLAGGNGNEEIEKIRKMALELRVIENVVFHDPLYGKELDAIFNICHVAAGALGIHRKGLHLTSELKLREYCARGIPFFMSCYDPDFENVNFALKVSEDDMPIDINKICNFTKKIYLQNNYLEFMHNYAKEYIDWTVKVKKMFD